MHRRLLSLRINQFRHVKPGTSVHFGGRISLILGKNGTGKSTLLQLAGCALEHDFSQFEEEEFDVVYTIGRVNHGQLTVNVVHKREGTPLRSVFSFSMSLARADGTVVEYKQDPNRVTFTTDGTLLFEKFAMPAPGPQPLYSALPSDPGGLDAFNVFSGFWGYPSKSAWILDEALEGFKHAKSVHFATTLHNDRSTGSYQWNNRLRPPRSIAEAVGALSPDKLSSQLTLTDDTVTFLRAFVQHTDFQSGELRLRETARTVFENSQVNIWYGDPQYVFTRQDGSRIADDNLSFGQKRLLAFEFYLELNRDCVLADDLVNGMHHDWIASCLTDIGARQAILTSQNPILLDSVGFDSVKDMTDHLIRCVCEMADGREVMSWSNMTEFDANSVWAGKEVGLLSVSELLRSQGLW